ncbi:hypothetical protein [Streptomyces hesseae]|uniref:Uncharacterized protein n=1 Tax=Streptomyces hesseae TaxID=3075519 RepID=A0ABU2SHF4_9ACTN|nr:hypothetical protein [Streptomyces sp. DSM 40473]MDT0448327.1 hypothetical protein [Streptomyces sp. DSM 40473]
MNSPVPTSSSWTTRPCASSPRLRPNDPYGLITERAGRSLILTPDRAPQAWYPLFLNPVVAESLLDRLINNSHQLFMNRAGYRPDWRPGAAAGDTGKKAAWASTHAHTRRITCAQDRGIG